MNWLIGIDRDGDPVAIPTDRVAKIVRLKDGEALVKFRDGYEASETVRTAMIVREDEVCGMLHHLAETQAQPPTVLWSDIREGDPGDESQREAT